MNKILLVTGRVEGGVGAHVADLAQGLSDAGWEVSVAAPPGVSQRFGLAERAAHLLDMNVGARPSPRRDAHAVVVLRRQMPRADVVHAHGLRAGALAVLACRSLRRSPPLVIVTSHNGPPNGPLARWVYRLLESVVTAGADRLLVVSPDLPTKRSGRSPIPVELAVIAAPAPSVSQASSASAGARSATRSRVRSQWEIGPAHTLIVSVGRLAPQKALHRLVEALAEVAAGGHHVAGLIVGEGPERGALQQQITARGAPVRLIGRRSDVPDLLVACDLVVSSATWEGQPVWLQEAITAGAAVVATDVGGIADLLAGAGVLVDADGDESSNGRKSEVAHRLAVEVLTLLDHPDQLEALRAASRERAPSLPTPQRATEAALMSYRRAAAYRSQPHVD